MSELSRNPKNEGKNRPICACGTNMTLVQFDSYYDCVWYWTCEKKDCKTEDEFIDHPDRYDKGEWT